MESNLSELSTKHNSHQFSVSDVVVIQNHIIWPLGSDSLFTIVGIKGDFLGDHVSMVDINGNVWTSGVKFLRHATVAEHNAKRRLTNAEQALAEVS
ncbi:hypothetical protein [Acinetobacter nosocomialis]|uniref:hypothetical protein n=1 Tax=Acinetobacter nosocomialis TaxID=106654 RepID=UPI003D367A26